MNETLQALVAPSKVGFGLGPFRPLQAQWSAWSRHAGELGRRDCRAGTAATW